MTAEQLAQLFHATYARLAPEHGRARALPWPDIPAQNRELMIAICGEILERLEAQP